MTYSVLLALICGVSAQAAPPQFDIITGIEDSMPPGEVADYVTAPPSLPTLVIRASDVDQESIKFVQIISPPGMEQIPFYPTFHRKQSVFRISWTYTREGATKATTFRNQYRDKRIRTEIGAFAREDYAVIMPRLPVFMKRTNAHQDGREDDQEVLFVETEQDAEKVVAGLNGR